MCPQLRAPWRNSVVSVNPHSDPKHMTPNICQMTRNLFLDFSSQLQPCTTQAARYVDYSQSRRVCWSLVTCMGKLIFRVMQGSSRHQRLYNNSSTLLSLVSLFY